MSRKIEAPTVEHRNDADVYSHPAFAQISANRVSGGTMLYGSDFQHNQYIAIRIGPSKLHRRLNHDSAMGESRDYIEAKLSEAQWAEFVSSLNVGSGVQCTLDSFNGEMIPALPRPSSRRDQFSAEMKQKIEKSLAHMDDLLEEIDGMKISEKQKEVLRSHLRMSRQELLSNMPFVLKCFAEHMEATVHKARVEINAYGTHILMRTGLAALDNPGAASAVIGYEGPASGDGGGIDDGNDVVG
ncbi:hypothetical protein [Burkholderia gladioli]|uniref:hypothetical protein n=1 Tax=Burkholderia gladioli TaxID=28095 RepID=UPI00164226AC|nr:hypothetical protein [Burkholderia gladioli]